MLILAQEMFAWRHRKLPWLLILLSNLVMAKGAWRHTHSSRKRMMRLILYLKAPRPPCPWVAETLRFEEEQSRSGQYEAERGNNTSPVKFLGFLTSVQNCSELFSFSRILEKTKKRRWREFLLLVGLTHLTPPDAT